MGQRMARVPFVNGIFFLFAGITTLSTVYQQVLLFFLKFWILLDIPQFLLTNKKCK